MISGPKEYSCRSHWMSCETYQQWTRSAPGVMRSPGPYRNRPIIGACPRLGPIINNYVNYLHTCIIHGALRVCGMVWGGWLRVVVVAGGAWGLLRAMSGTRCPRSKSRRDPPPGHRIYIYGHPQGRKSLKAATSGATEALSGTSYNS